MFQSFIRSIQLQGLPFFFFAPAVPTERSLVHYLGHFRNVGVEIVGEIHVQVPLWPFVAFGANGRHRIYVALPLRTVVPPALLRARLGGAAANGQQPLAALLSGLASRLVLVGRLIAIGPLSRWCRLLSANGRWWRRLRWLLSANGRWWLLCARWFPRRLRRNCWLWLSRRYGHNFVRSFRKPHLLLCLRRWIGRRWIGHKHPLA